MTPADLPLPSGVRRLFDLAMETVLSGVRRFRRGDANATAAEALTLLRRLTRLLRFAFVLAATWLPALPPVRRWVSARKAPRIMLRRPSFQLFPAYRIVTVDGHARAQPAAFARAVRDPVLSAQRKLDALAAALFNPITYIRRIARGLPTRLLVIGWRPPKRPPPTHRRDYWEELVSLWSEAKYAVSQWRRRTAAAA